MSKSKAKTKSSRSARDKRAGRARAARDARRPVIVQHEAQRRIEEFFSDDTPAQRSAELILERLDGGPVPAGISRFFLLGGSAERARTVAAEVARLSPGSATALTLAADVALHVDDDARAASALIDRLLYSGEREREGDRGGEGERASDGDGERDIPTLASHLVAVGRVAEALALVEELLPDEPGDEDAQEVRADALAVAYASAQPAHDDDEEQLARAECRCWSGRAWAECCAPAERRALERFGDRKALKGLRRAVQRFTTTEPHAAHVVRDAVDRWMREAAADVDSEVRETLVGLAVEHAWIVGGDDTDADAPIDLDAPLALFAADPSTTMEHATTARRWLEHCEYGLWQVADPTPAPGVWLTDIVSGRRRYAAIAPEHLQGTARWSVLLGPLVAIDGTWRTTSAVVPLRPSEADVAAELAEEMLHVVVAAMSGKRVTRRSRAKKVPEPFGVLVADTEPASPQVADLLGKVIGSALPQFVSLTYAGRAAASRVVNIDPEQDLPQPHSGSMIPFEASPEANAAWIALWPDQPLPALGGRSPRAAATRLADQPRVEALLRELEHDADLLAQQGQPAPDLAALRKELRMPADVWR